MAKYKTRRKLHKRKKHKSKRKIKKLKRTLRKHYKKRTRKHGGAAQRKPSPPTVPPPSIPSPPSTPKERNTPVLRTEGFKVPGAAAAEEITEHKWRVEPKKPWEGYMRPKDIAIDNWLEKPNISGEHGSLPKEPLSFVERHPQSPIPLDLKGERAGIYSKGKNPKKRTPTPPNVPAPLPPPLSPKQKKN